MFGNIECWLGFLDTYANVLTSYLPKSANIWHFVHARIILLLILEGKCVILQILLFVAVKPLQIIDTWLSYNNRYEPL